MADRKNPVCTHCFVRQPSKKERSLRLAKSSRSFLGFFKFQCVACKQKFLYPMSWGYLSIYILSLLVFVGTAVPQLINGEAPMCFILGIAGAFGLAKNTKVSREVKEAEARARHENVVEVFS